MTGKQIIYNLDLMDPTTNLKELASIFESFSICHIYRALNPLSEKLSKEGSNMPMGEVQLVEVKDGETLESRQNLWT
jgi:hypothetical protein